MRRELLEISALVRMSSGPDPGCLAELHALLTSGTDSPLFNPGVPAEQLAATLERARRGLTTNACPAQTIQKSELLGDAGLRGFGAVCLLGADRSRAVDVSAYWLKPTKRSPRAVHVTRGPT
jgi:hypothetical protein